MQPKETELGSFQSAVVVKVTKIINMPPEYFVECIENEEKFRMQITGDDDDDDEVDDDVDHDDESDDDKVGDDGAAYGSDHHHTEAIQESLSLLNSIKGIKSDDDDCNTSTTSGYISASLTDVTETASVVSVDGIPIIDTDTLFVSDNNDNISNMSPNDEVIAANKFIQGDNDSASGSLEMELNLDEYTWEVECTKVFWKSFTKQPVALKRHALEKIVRLAKGEWRQISPIRTTKSSTLHLFRIKLTAYLHIIWQLAISYSPKRTSRFRSECSCDKTDVIYSQIIRIWRIVHIKKIKKCIKLIQESVNKEKSCDPEIGSKKLKVLQMASDDACKTSPTLYCSADVTSVPDDSFLVYVPADHRSTPLQLYKMDNALLYNMYFSQGDTLDSNCMFKEGFLLEQKLSPEENDIIDMDPNKSIILLGRSGTGKTICCLHRLWKQFFDYWIEKIQYKEEVTIHQSHLRQAFVTKSSILCNHFKKRFYSFVSGRKDMWQQFQKFHENKSKPFKIQEVHPYAFPLFVTSRDWLLLLDISLEGKRFFNYNKDGSLLTNIIESECIEGSFEDIELFDVGLNVGSPNSQQMKNSWRKVDSDFFISKVWPKLKLNQTTVDPILIWMEIHSFIKGSLKALRTKDGWLTKEDYINFGAKMAPHFKGNREFAYKCFEQYQVIKMRYGYFDDNDLIHNLYHRLLKMKRQEPLVHRLYVDEVQDFTQAELALLLQCSHIPYGQFLTGDTAQNIMRSVAFRFCDLRSVFHDFKENLSGQIKVPEICTLTQNFRSHSGILQLAASVIKLLTNFFSSSLDRLPMDKGMFPGPKPVLISSCSDNDLAQLVRVNREESGAIEFGARQAIIVRSNQVKSKLPDELRVGIVLTVNEAKGLEFDDVLLYNFFADSEVRKYIG